MKKLIKISLVFLSLFLIAFSLPKNNALPKGFVYVSDIIPDIKLDLRYKSYDNFIGKPIDGYLSEKCILTKEAALALKKVEDDLEKQGYCLLIYDAYRPQKAVNQFVKWAKAINDTLMKSQFYPNVSKKDLFKKGYIASKSRHSSGSTVDLTLISNKDNKVVDMGSSYDFFGPQSWVAYDKISSKQKTNRKLLQTVMLKNGFRSYSKEWWHFTLRYEPYRNQYFDFNIE
jgi:D-alanyl-D-alanine dipeptidase